MIKNYSIYTFIILYCFINVNASYGQTDTAQSGKYYRDGLLKYENTEYIDAITNFESSIKYDSKNWNAYREKANAEKELKKFKEAIQDYGSALLINKNDRLSYSGRGEAKRFSGDYASSIEDYNMALKLYPDDPMALFGRATSYRMLQKYNEAISDYSIFIKRAPNYSTTYLQRGIAFSGLEKYNEAISDFNQFIKLEILNKEDPTECYYYRAYAYEQLEKPDSAIIDWENYFKKFPKWSEGLRLLAKAYADNDNMEVARKYYQESLQLDSNNLKAYFYWGVCEVTQGDPMKGRNLLEKVERESNTKLSPAFYFYLGVSEASTGNVEKGIAHFDKALELSPDYLQVYYTRLNLLFDNPKYESIVMKDLGEAIMHTFDPTNLSWLYFARGMKYETQGKFILARQDIDKAILINPDYPDYHLMKAWVVFYSSNAILAQSGSDTLYLDDEVIKEIDQSIKLDPNYWQAYLVKASVYNHTGKREIACKNVKMAIKLGGKISKGQEDLICKGKELKPGEDDEIQIFTRPKLPKGVENKKHN